MAPDGAVIEKAMQIVRVKNVSKIFADGSNFGEFVRIAKRQNAAGRGK